MIVFRLIMSFLFAVQMYIAMTIIGIVFFPLILFSRNMARVAARLFCRWVIISLRLLCNVKTEIRGTIPQGEVLIAPKHHSFYDIIVIFAVTPRAKFVLKRELIYTPILGQYALRMGCIPVKRGERSKALVKMREDVLRGKAEPGQLVIYPQGTRIAPGVIKPYKGGTGALYQALGQPCVPVATNIGFFWPKRALLRRPGTAVVEFLPEIPRGLEISDFMHRIEAVIEKHSDLLLAEAGFVFPPNYPNP